jgi:hypothetical protein
LKLQNFEVASTENSKILKLQNFEVASTENSKVLKLQNFENFEFQLALSRLPGFGLVWFFRRHSRSMTSIESTSDKIGRDALQKLWENVVADFNKLQAKKNDAKVESEAVEPEKPCSQQDCECEANLNGHAGVQRDDMQWGDLHTLAYAAEKLFGKRSIATDIYLEHAQETQKPVETAPPAWLERTLKRSKTHHSYELLGKLVRKVFWHKSTHQYKPYQGQVVSVSIAHGSAVYKFANGTSKVKYTVKYEDGDAEDMPYADLRKILQHAVPRSPQAQRRASRQSLPAQAPASPQAKRRHSPPPPRCASASSKGKRRASSAPSKPALMMQCRGLPTKALMAAGAYPEANARCL